MVEKDFADLEIRILPSDDRVAGYPVQMMRMGYIMAGWFLGFIGFQLVHEF